MRPYAGESASPTQQVLLRPKAIITVFHAIINGKNRMVVCVASSGVGILALRRFCCLCGKAHGGREGSTTPKGRTIEIIERN